MFEKKLAGWMIICRPVSPSQTEDKKKTNKKHRYDGRIPEFLKNSEKTYLPIDLHCRCFYIRNKILFFSKQKSWFECVLERFNCDKINDTCVICLHQFEPKKHVTTLSCGHTFHKKCLVEWIMRKESCPLCLYQISIKNMKRKPKPVYRGVDYIPYLDYVDYIPYDMPHMFF